MSTHASISVRESDNSIKTIYVNGDGGLSHTGTILFNHYNSFEKADDLVNHGDAVVIGKNIGERVDNQRYCRDLAYAVAVNDQCRFFHRDNDERLVILDMFKCELNNYMAYNYLYEDGNWYVSCSGSKNKWVLLRTLLVKDAFRARLAS